jgi:acyl-coenzyme A thioesterase PaaI-like protein
MTDLSPGNAEQTQRSEHLRRIREHFSSQGLVGTLGAWLVELEPGRATIEIPFGHRVAGESGSFHSSVVAGAVQACGGAAAATLAKRLDIMPASLDLTYEGAAGGDLLHATGLAVAETSTLWRTDIVVTCLRGDKVWTCARGRVTFVARPQEA